MKKILVCLPALFLCVAGCFAVFGKTEKHNNMETVGNGTMEVVIFVDDGEDTKEVAEAICEKIHAVIVDFKKLEKEELGKLLEKTDLIFLGMNEESLEFFDETDFLFSMEEMNGKRVSIFYLGNENGLAESERQAVNRNSTLDLAPGFSLSWDAEKRTEELSRMDGWITTAFTY